MSAAFTSAARDGQQPLGVLIVDDHQLGRRLIARVLAPAGFHAIEADSIAEADHVLARESPDALVLDLNLPDGDGLALARRCRNDPRTANCAIIACSASDRGDERQKALRAGADAFVLKPIDTRRFAELVSTLIARRQG